METWIDFLTAEFASPGKLLGHLSYVLLVASMMMRSMKLLRIVAVGAGVVSALYGWFFLRDFVTVFWEVVFVTVNLLQLLLMEIANRRARFGEEEARFVAAALPDVEKGEARRVLAIATRLELDEDAILTREGERPGRLWFVLHGAARVEKEGRMVGVCARDDFVGEIGFMLDSAATATTVVTHPMRCLVFETEALRALLAKNPPLRHALEASFNRDLVSKLVKANEKRDAFDVEPVPPGLGLSGKVDVLAH